MIPLLLIITFGIMSRLNNFLKTLTDFELAQFYNYRFHQFLPSSKQKIEAEFKERGLEIEKLDCYVKKENIINKKAQCPRCHSNKFYTAKERETLEFARSTIEVDEYYKTCLVCLFSAEKPKNYKQHKFISIFDYLRMKRKTRS